jgi:hypothetical protein
MHKLIYAAVVTAALWGLWNLSQLDFTQVYQAETKEVIINETPAWATDADAVEAAEKVIKRKALEAERTQLESEIVARQERVDAIEQELGF